MKNFCSVKTSITYYPDEGFIYILAHKQTSYQCHIN